VVEWCGVVDSGRLGECGECERQKRVYRNSQEASEHSNRLGNGAVHTILTQIQQPNSEDGALAG
jgi:hypothetical protein